MDGETLALRPRVGVVLRGLAGLEERPERNVVLPEGLSIVLAPGPRGLARVDDGALGCIYWFFRSEKISYS